MPVFLCFYLRILTCSCSSVCTCDMLTPSSVLLAPPVSAVMKRVVFSVVSFSPLMVLTRNRSSQPITFLPRAHRHPLAPSLFFPRRPASHWLSVCWRRWPVGRQSWAGSGRELIDSGRDKQLERASSTEYLSCQHST